MATVEYSDRYLPDDDSEGWAKANRSKARQQFKVLRYFDHAHLPEKLQLVVEPIEAIAYEMALSPGASRDPQEIAAGLRKLLEAKDCFVRAQLDVSED